MWWIVQRKGKKGKNRKWKTVAAEHTRARARECQNAREWCGAEDNFCYRVRKARIEVL